MKKPFMKKTLAGLLAVIFALSFSFPVFAAGTLAKGSRGQEVKKLQQRLTELGFSPGKADGVFGGATALALQFFQGRNGLSMTGKADADTLALLYGDDAKGAEPTDDDVKGYVTGNGLPLLVNLDHPLPEGYVYYDLVVMNQYCDKSVVKIKHQNTFAEREAVDALMVMLKAAKAAGIGSWQISAAGRTVADQQSLMNSRVNTYIKNGLSKKKAQTAASKLVAQPGCSEHHLGTCFDITVPGKTFAGTKQHKWLLANCWDYGFILRYTKEKTEITGFSAEAWHFRYVGVEHALKMKEMDFCLEEYIAWMEAQ